MGNLQLQCQADNQKLVSGNMSICLSLLEIRMQLKVAMASERALWKGKQAELFVGDLPANEVCRLLLPQER